MTMIQGNSASPADEAEAVTPSDATVFAEATRGLYVGETGDVSVVMAKRGNTVVFPLVPAGQTLPIAVKQVLAATTADSIVRMW